MSTTLYSEYNSVLDLLQRAPHTKYCMHVSQSWCLCVTGQGSAQAQCWTSSGCTGDTVPADDARDCCAGTEDGQSYGVGPSNCEVEQCIGESSL